MQIKFLIIAITIAICFTLSNANEILDSLQYTTLERTTNFGKLYRTRAISPNPNQTFEQPVVHLYGSTYYEMGYAQGELLSEEIFDFIFVAVPSFYIAGDVAKHSINHYLPEEIAQYMNRSKNSDIPLAMMAATDWIYTQQIPYFSQLAINFDDELKGIADGMCDDLISRGKIKNCNKNDALAAIRSWNFFPDLNRLGCTLTSTRDTANDSESKFTGNKETDENMALYYQLFNKKFQSNIIQSRLLDFGVGPFVQYQALLVRHFSNFTYKDVDIYDSRVFPFSKSKDFISQGFPGMVGVVSSVSQTLTQSQKVFLDMYSDDDADHAPKLTNDQRESLNVLSKTMYNIQKTIANQPQSVRKQIFNSKFNLLDHLAEVSPTKRMQSYINHPTLHSFVDNGFDLMTYLSILPAPKQHLLRTSLEGFRPGSYNGVADLWAMRYLIEKAVSIADVISIAHTIPRTWPIWLLYSTSNEQSNQKNWGTVDKSLVPTVMIEYGIFNLTFMRDMTVTNITQQQPFENILYVDKRPQPSPGHILQDLWTEGYGKLGDIQWQIDHIPVNSTSGDVHAIFYDWNTRDMYVSLGKLDKEKYEYCIGCKAYQRPYMKYNWERLLNEQH